MVDFDKAFDGVSGNIALACEVVDFDKAFDSVSGNIALACVR